MSANYFLDNKDLRFQFEHGIDRCGFHLADFEVLPDEIGIFAN